MLKLIPGLLGTILFVAATTASAELVDNQSYTTDTVWGLDWLDLTETASLTMNEALAANEGWRFATNAEVKGLFGQLFTGYYDTDEDGLSNSYDGAYADQKEDVEAFQELFGINLNVVSVPTYHTYGVYADEDDVIRLMGVNHSVDIQTMIAGLNHISDFGVYVDEVSNTQVGTYLVRSSDYVAGPQDINALTDISSDAIADMATLNLSERVASGAVVTLLSGSDGMPIDSYAFFNDNWGAVRMDSGGDANGDAVADDPIIAVLAQSRKTGEAQVQVRAASDGAKLRSNLKFFSSNYAVVDVAILDDTNGDGVGDDPSVAVLAEKTTSGRQAVILRSLQTGKQLGNWTITQADHELVAIAGVGMIGGESRISVLTIDTSTDNAYILAIRVSDGSLLEKQKIVGSWLSVKDLAIQLDGNGDGQTDDPAYVVLGDESKGNSLLRIRDVASGAKIRDISALSDNWNARRIGISPDVSGNNIEDALIIATNKSKNSVRIKIRDLESGDNGGSFDPNEP
jgi:hypothetical protein